MEMVRGHPNIINLIDYVVDPSTKTPTLVNIVAIVYNVKIGIGIC